MMNGGIFHHYKSHRTTHIIAINLPDTKVKNLKGNEPICHPKWIVESLKAGKLLDYTDYLLYSNVTSSQPKISFPKVVQNEPSKVAQNEPPKAKDAKDEKFLGEFYNNSRLHHISTMGAKFKEYVNELRSKHDGDFTNARLKLKPTPDYIYDKKKVKIYVILYPYNWTSELETTAAYFPPEFLAPVFFYPPVIYSTSHIWHQ